MPAWRRVTAPATSAIHSEVPGFTMLSTGSSGSATSPHGSGGRSGGVSPVSLVSVVSLVSAVSAGAVSVGSVSEASSMSPGPAVSEGAAESSVAGEVSSTRPSTSLPVVEPSRGDTLVAPDARPFVGQDLDAMVCWMTDTPLSPRTKLALEHTTRWVRAMVTGSRHRLDVNTLERQEGLASLGLNDIGRIQLRTTAPLFYDEYKKNRATGSFILVDEATNNTFGTGMLLPPS